MRQYKKNGRIPCLSLFYLSLLSLLLTCRLVNLKPVNLFTRQHVYCQLVNQQEIRLQKGGVPAAPSGTATLLRLSPNRQSHLRRLPPKRVRPPALGVTNFRDLTGGVYKARERIHRAMADARLLANPAS